MKHKYFNVFINIVVAISVFSVSFIVSSQPAFAVTGQVLDQNGKNITGATITMNYNGTITTTTTNSSGYSFIDPCPFAQNGQPGSAPYTLTLTVPNGYWATTPTTANSTSTRGEFQQNGTGCGQQMVNGVWKHYPTSSSPDPVNFGVTSVAPNCTTTPINCGACTAPANTCSNGNGTQTCTLSQPQTCTQVTTSQSCTINNCNAGSSCVSGACQVNTFSISGNVSDANSANVPNVTVSAGGKNATTDASGNYTIANLTPASYTVTMTIPSGYVANGPTSQTVTLNADKTGVNFKLARPNCTTTPINCSACTAPANTCSNGNGTQTCTLSQPATCIGVVISQSCTLNNCNTGSSCVSGACQVNTFSISGNVSDETNTNVSNVTVSAGGKNATTDTSGNYTIANLVPANYTVTMTIPSGYVANGATSQAITLNANKTGVNFKLTKEFQISGNVFNDLNKNGIQEAGENNYAATPPITINPPSGTVTANADGSYTIKNLIPGTYSVTYGTPPAGYYMTSPLTGPPNSFSVTVGSSCTASSAPGATCSNGNVTNLSFGISNTFPWYQSTCGDLRNDNGIIDNLPSGISAIFTTSPCTSPSILFTGNANANLGKGTASPIVGGASYPEVYPSSYSPLSTSYPSLYSKATNAGITPQDVTLAPINCSLSGCTLPSTLTHGIYIAKNTLTLNAWTAPANQDYVFLVNGNLTINGPITVPVGSTVLFSVNGNITVASSVGTATLTSATPSLAGWYVAGGSFILPSAGNCTDLRLNIAGSVIVDSLGTGGTFQNNRDLCGGDTSNPTVSFIQRLDMILNAPQFIETQQVISQEVAP